MSLSRHGYWLAFALTLIACGGETLSTEDGTSGGPNGTWVSIPTTPEPAFPDDDPNFQPVSKKVPAGSSSGTSSGTSGTSGGTWDSGTSSSSSSSSSGSSGAIYGGPFLSNDIDDPEVATVCVDRAAAKSSYAIVPADARIPPGFHLSVTRDLTEHRYGDGVYRTKFTLFFRGAPDIVEDEEYGRTRFEEMRWLNVHLDAAVSNPNAFTVGQPQEVAIGWGWDDERYTCSRDGSSSYWFDGELLPYERGVVTLTRRDATGLSGTIDIGTKKLTFDAPFGETYPGEDGICCLK